MGSSTDEIWLPCDTGNWENRDYEVSSMGRVRNVKTGELLKLHKSKVRSDGSTHPQYSIEGAWWHPDVLAHFVFLMKDVSLNRMSTLSRVIAEAESKLDNTKKKIVVERDEPAKHRTPVKPRVPADSEYQIVSSAQSFAQSLYKPAAYERKESTDKPFVAEKDKSKPSEPRSAQAESKEKSPYIKTVAHVLWQYKEGAAARGYTWKLSDDDAFGLMIRPCYYCGCEPGTKNKNGLNGIDRVDNYRGYEIDNVVPCCGPCNLLKGGRTVEEFLKQVMAIAEFQKKSRESR